MQGNWIQMERGQITEGGRQAFYLAEDENIPWYRECADAKDLKSNRERDR